MPSNTNTTTAIDPKSYFLLLTSLTYNLFAFHFPSLYLVQKTHANQQNPTSMLSSCLNLLSAKPRKNTHKTKKPTTTGLSFLLVISTIRKQK